MMMREGGTLRENPDPSQFLDVEIELIDSNQGSLPKESVVRLSFGK